MTGSEENGRPAPSPGRFPAARTPSTSRKADRDVVPFVLSQYVDQTKPKKRLKEMSLDRATRAAVEDFVAEYKEGDLLRAHGLQPDHKILLTGPPGNGKTTLAGALATALALPFLTVRYDGIVDSYLGETAARLRKVFDYAFSRPCLLFFDEFDSVGKERGDVNESGEMRRVVGSILVQLDALPSTCVVVCATNHAEMLDRAATRRFDVVLEMAPPDERLVKEWLGSFAKTTGEDLSSMETDFVAGMAGKGHHFVERFLTRARKTAILSCGQTTVAAVMAARLAALMIPKLDSFAPISPPK
jgi:SpoVK/Ycf46/Vps4 family AAA+-type ATPase